MENNTNQDESLFNIRIEGAARDLLSTAATWARIIAIIGFVSAGLSVLGAVMGDSGEGATSRIGSILGSLIVAAIVVAINIFLYRFATNTLASLSTMSQVQFNEGINNLRTYFKILGIIVIIVVSLIILFVLVFRLGRGM